MHFKLVGFLKTYFELLGNLVRKGVAADSRTARYPDFVVEEGDVASGGTDVDNNCWQVPFLGRLNQTCRGADTGLDDDRLKIGLMTAVDNGVDNFFWHGREQNGQRFLAPLDYFVV